MVKRFAKIDMLKYLSNILILNVLIIYSIAFEICIALKIITYYNRWHINITKICAIYMIFYWKNM